MKLWKLNNSRGYVGYAAALGFVVRASTETKARQIAAHDAGEEGKDVWLNPKTSTCVHLKVAGYAGVILRESLDG